MFYTTKENDHGFPHDPFKAIITPRPIGWIGSLDKEGVANLAPHSYFNAIPIIHISLFLVLLPIKILFGTLRKPVTLLVLWSLSICLML